MKAAFRSAHVDGEHIVLFIGTRMGGVRLWFDPDMANAMARGLMDAIVSRELKTYPHLEHLRGARTSKQGEYKREHESRTH